MPWFNNDGSPAGVSVLNPGIQGQWFKIPFNLTFPENGVSAILNTGIILPAKKIIFNGIALVEISLAQGPDTIEFGFEEAAGEISQAVSNFAFSTESFAPNSIGNQGAGYVLYDFAQRATIYSVSGDHHHVQDLTGKSEANRELKVQMRDNTTGGSTNEGILFLEIITDRF